MEKSERDSKPSDKDDKKCDKKSESEKEKPANAKKSRKKRAVTDAPGRSNVDANENSVEPFYD